jgi:hypothetical protein
MYGVASYKSEKRVFPHLGTAANVKLPGQQSHDPRRVLNEWGDHACGEVYTKSPEKLTHIKILERGGGISLAPVP